MIDWQAAWQATVQLISIIILVLVGVTILAFGMAHCPAFIAFVLVIFILIGCWRMLYEGIK